MFIDYINKVKATRANWPIYEGQWQGEMVVIGLSPL